jgi:hypothetical protein
MTTGRQLEANRRNAARSSGPRSRAGMQRASQNSFRHGLSSAARFDRCKKIEQLAHELAGQPISLETLEYARNLARAKFDLDHIRRVRLSLVKRVLLIGRLHRPRYLLSQLDQIIFTKPEMALVERAIQRGTPLRLRRRRRLPGLPQSEPGHTAEALRRVHTECVAINRYQREASGRFNRALRRLLRSIPIGE